MAAELGVGYISILPETSKIVPEITKALGKAESGAESSGKGIGSKLTSGIGKTLAVGAGTIGAAAGGVLGVAFTKGFGRLTAIENAQSKLSGLGHSAETVAGIMDNALASVKGTAYGLGDAAAVSASLVAAGIKPGEELERRLKTVADTAAIAGAEIGDIGLIFGSVAARGKLQGDDMLQLMSRGIPVMQLLAEETGVTSAEISKMVSEGKIDFATFANAMEKGMGGAALKTGETVQGAMANLTSALGRMGAKMLDPFFKAAPGLITGLTTVVDEATSVIDPLAAKAGEKLAPALANIGDILTTKVAPAVGPALGQLQTNVTNMINAVAPVAREVGPSLVQLGISLGAVAGQLSVATWQALGDVLVALAPIVVDHIVPALNKLSGFMSEHPQLVTAFVSAWMGAKVIGTVAGPISNVAGAVTATGAAFRGANLAEGLLSLAGHAGSANPIMARLGVTVTSFGSAMFKAGNLIKFVGPALTALSGPIGWAAAGIAAVTAGLALFFTKTETGKRLWGELVDAFKVAGEWLSGVFSGIWGQITSGWQVSLDWINEKVTWVGNLFFGLKDLFVNRDFSIRLGDALGVDEDSAIVGRLLWIRDTAVDVLNAFRGKWEEAREIVGPIVSAFKDKWAEFSGDLAAKYREHIAPAVEEFKRIAGELWGKLSEFTDKLWEPVLKPALIALGAILLGPVVIALGAVVTAVGLVIGAIGALAYAVISMPGWVKDAVEKVQHWFHDTKEKVSNWFSEMGNTISSTARSVVDTAFGGMQRGLDALHGWFDRTTHAIGDSWKKVKELTAAPVRFVIDTVYNNGIRKAWNAVSKLVGLEELPEHKAGFARGGVLPGYSPGKDDYRFYSPQFGFLELGGGEAIMRPEWTRAVGGKNAVNAMNAAARSGGVRGVRRMLGQGAAFADGGVFDETIGNVMNQLRGEHGKPYQYGGTGNPSWDCSGLWSGIVQALNGGNLRGGRIFNTESIFENFGFEKGLSGRVTIGVMRGGGGPNSHMAGTIDGTNVESAGDHGVQIGGRARGSDNSMFNLHWTLTKFLGEFVSGGNGGGGGVSIRSIVARMMEPILDGVGRAIPNDIPGIIGALPKAMFDKLKNTALEFIKGKGDSMGGAPRAVGAGVEQWRPLVEKILAEKGFDRNKAGIVLRRMDQESSADPNSINNWDSNAAKGTPSKGLMQLIDPTFQSNKDPGYDNIWDPEANIRASINYAIRKYGSLEAAYNRAGGYALGGVLPTFKGVRLYDQGGFIPHGGGALNLSGKPEPVLTHTQWGHFSTMVGHLGNLVPVLDRLTHTLGLGPAAAYLEPLSKTAANLDKFTADVHTLVTGDDQARREVGLQFGGSWAAGAKSVQDAEKALLEVRKQVKQDADGITDAEKALAEAREELTKAESEGGGISVAQRRKLQDAEEALSKARKSGKTDQIASAEKRLSRAREDAAAQVDKNAGKNADKIKAAMKKVEKAEDTLSDAREKATDRLEKITEAENAVIKARIEVISDIANSLSAGIGKTTEFATRLAGITASLAASATEARQDFAKLQIQRVNDHIALLKARREERIANLDVGRARAQGRVDVLAAEKALADAREKAALLASTSVGALGKAIDRFRATGVFAIEEVSASVIANTAEVQAAQWGIKEARIKALLDEQQAQLAAAQASWQAAEASLAQSQSVAMLAIATERLQAHAGAFYGMTQHGAQRAEKGWGGFGGVLSGLFKTLAGGAAAVGAFATGNIPGAVIAGISALGSLKDTVYSGIQAWNNRQEIGDSWKKMDWKGKLLSVLGLAGDAAIAGAGVHEIANGRIDTGKALLEAGPVISDLTLGALFENAKQKQERAESIAAEKRAALQHEAEVKRAEIQAKMAADIARLNSGIGITEAAQEIAKLQKEIAQANTKEQAIALNELAIIAGQKRDQLIEIGRAQSGELTRTVNALASISSAAEGMSRQAGAPEIKQVTVNLTRGSAYSADEVEKLLKEILGDASAIKLRIEQLEKQGTDTSALALVTDRRR